MNGGRIILLAVIAIVGSAGTATSQTKHFTFHIPVEVEALLPGVFVSASCEVFPANSTMPANRIGHGWAYAPPIDSEGNVSGTVVVSFDAYPGKDPAAGTHYRCILQGGTESGNQCHLMGDPGWGGADCENKPGTELVNTLEGPIP
jgi:hypothetical protein